MRTFFVIHRPSSRPCKIPSIVDRLALEAVEDAGRGSLHPFHAELGRAPSCPMQSLRCTACIVLEQAQASLLQQNAGAGNRHHEPELSEPRERKATAIVQLARIAGAELGKRDEGADD